MYRALLFDLDGTLSDTDALHSPAWLNLLKRHGVEADEEFYRNRISGRSNAVIVRELLPNLTDDEVGAGKPDPAPYTAALQRFGLDPEEALAFEDSPSGIASATGAGIPTVGIASTQKPDLLLDAGAFVTAEDFTDPKLWALLEG